MSDAPTQAAYVDLAADIVSAYVTKNAVPIAELPALISSVHSALSKTAQGTTEQSQEELRPAVSIKKSITPDYLICLDDGKRFKSLKRHLRTAYDLGSGPIKPFERAAVL
jgi:predicted transcriptional regulator